MTSPVPTIFSKARKQVRNSRAWRAAKADQPADFLLREMAEDVEERLGFVRYDGREVLTEGFASAQLAQLAPWPEDAQVTYCDADFDTPSSYETESFDLVVSTNSLDTVNDLPGALIQMRELLRPGGLAIATFIGGQSLLKLRRAMLEAEPDRPAARMHPLVDPRSCPQLLQRAGWKAPVVDSHVLTVRYSSLERLVADLREQALGSVLANRAPPLSRSAYSRASDAFLAQADEDGKVSETFEIITLTGRR